MQVFSVDLRVALSVRQFFVSVGHGVAYPFVFLFSEWTQEASLGSVGFIGPGGSQVFCRRDYLCRKSP